MKYKKNRKISKIFKINDLVDLRLINNRTYIYINNKPLTICTYLLMNIPVDRIQDYDYIESIDEAAEILDRSVEHSFRIRRLISPEEEFIGHCSNIQAFFENGLNTDILHSNIAFPLLKELVKLEYEPARRVFKEEIARRYNEGTINSKRFLHLQGYLNFLNEDEKTALRGYEPKLFQKLIYPKNPDLLFKIVILGENNVGRSTLGIKYLNSRDYDFIITIRTALAVKNIELDDYFIRLQIWFISNHINNLLFKLYLAGTLGVIIMYDITNPNSLNSILKWIQIIRENERDIPILLVGNKSDLKEKRAISEEEAIKIKNKNNLAGNMEISLKTGNNVREMFNEITRLIFSITHQIRT